LIIETLDQERRGTETLNKIVLVPLWLIILAGLVGAQSLDYQTYKTTVEPIFLKKRPTHARCIVCHASANHAFRLEPLNKGATTWTEAQSRKNFETVSHLVKPGKAALEPLTDLTARPFCRRSRVSLGRVPVCFEG
jgi:hypothetical protein